MSTENELVSRKVEQLAEKVKAVRAANQEAGEGEGDDVREPEKTEQKGADPSQAIELMQQIADQIEPLALVVIDGTKTLEKQHRYIGQYQKVAFLLDVGDEHPLDLFSYRLAEGEWQVDGFNPDLVNQLSEERIKSHIEAAIDRRLGNETEIDIPDKIDGPLYCGNTGRKLKDGETPMPVAYHAAFSQISGTPIDNLNMRIVIREEDDLSLEVTKAEADLLVEKKDWQIGPVPKGAFGSSPLTEEKAAIARQVREQL